MKNIVTNNILKNKLSPFFDNTKVYTAMSNYSTDSLFIGWGRKHSGLKALSLSSKYKSSFLLCEDGFLRSVKLGFEDDKSYSIIFDDVGIYYDSSSPSKLENLLNDDSIFEDMDIERVKNNIEYIKKNRISKYNDNLPFNDSKIINSKKKKVLLISQSLNDLSLKYGQGDKLLADDIVGDIYNNYNPKYYDYYIKIHPDVIKGKKHNSLSLDSFEYSGFNIIKENYNPIDMLEHFDVVYTQTSQMGMEALILGKEVICLGNPFYSGWGLTKDRYEISRREKKRTIEELFYASYMLYPTYINPLTKNTIEIEEALLLLNKEKYENNIDKNKSNMYGFSLWKRNYVSNFIDNKVEFKNNRVYISTRNKKPVNHFIWGMKKPEIIPNEMNKIIRVEDGFLRSVNLGSDLTQPYSLIFDDKGIYFNSEKESKLEIILNDNINFNPIVNKIGSQIKEYITNNNLSKYNNTKTKKLNIKTDKEKIILVIGQVDDDASLVYSRSKITNSLELLKKVKKDNKEAFIVFKPHPDVISGNRESVVKLDEIDNFVDLIAVNNDLHSCIKASDEIHTISSLSGMEALIYGKEVVCYGLPFYSGWGLTTDKIKTQRRKQTRSLDELILASYYIYPRYFNPKTELKSDVFEIMDIILKEKKNASRFGLFIGLKRFAINLFKKIVKN